MGCIFLWEKEDKKAEENLIAENQRLRIAELRQKYPPKDLLALTGIARSTYYYYLSRTKRNEPGTIPSPFANNLILNFV